MTCIYSISNSRDSLIHVESCIASAGVDVLPLNDGLFDASRPDILRNASALLVDGYVECESTGHILTSAALNGLPRLLYLPFVGDGVPWPDRFHQLKPQRVSHLFNAVALTTDSADYLLGRPRYWPTDAEIGRALSWHCGAKLIAIEDADKNSWRMMKPSGKAWRMMLPKGLSAVQITARMAAAIILQRVVRDSWRIPPMQKLAANLQSPDTR